jgi:hypothetical protein
VPLICCLLVLWSGIDSLAFQLMLIRPGAFPLSAPSPLPPAQNFTCARLTFHIPALESTSGGRIESLGLG